MNASTPPGPGVADGFLREICAHAEREYPEECCGIVLGPAESDGRREPGAAPQVRRCRNAQNEMHRCDPVRFPRTAATAYFLDPRDLCAVHREMRERGEAIRVIYHSHIDAGAYFSEEDTRRAMTGGDPVYPGVDYLVLSVIGGRVEAWKLFRYDASAGSYLPLP